jgi:hypothetical protein
MGRIASTALHEHRSAGEQLPLPPEDRDIREFRTKPTMPMVSSMFSMFSVFSNDRAATEHIVECLASGREPTASEVNLRSFLELRITPSTLGPSRRTGAIWRGSRSEGGPAGRGTRRGGLSLDRAPAEG